MASLQPYASPHKLNEQIRSLIMQAPWSQLTKYIASILEAECVPNKHKEKRGVYQTKSSIEN